MVDYANLERLVVGGKALPKVSELEESGYNGEPVWATNALGDIVVFDPQTDSFRFPQKSTDQAHLQAA